VEQQYGPKIRILSNDSEEEKLSKIQLKCVYNYIKTIHTMSYATDQYYKWINLGKEFEIIPQKLLHNPKVSWFICRSNAAHVTKFL